MECSQNQKIEKNFTNFMLYELVCGSIFCNTLRKISQSIGCRRGIWAKMRLKSSHFGRMSNIWIYLLPIIAVSSWSQACAQVQWLERNTPAVTTLPGSKPKDVVLNLNSAFALAVKNSKTLLSSVEAVKRAAARVSEQKSGYLPSLSSTTTTIHLDQGSSANIGGTEVVFVKQDQTQLSVNGTLPIDFVGLIRAAVQQAEFSEIAARLDYNRLRNQLISDVKSAYYDVLRARAFVTVSKEALQNSQERLSTAELNFKVGTGTKFDVLRAETDVANARQNLLVSENRVNLTNAVLANVLNIDQNTPIKLDVEVEPSKDGLNFDKLLASAYKLRPEILQADANIAAAERGIRFAERSALPSLGISAGYQYTPDASGFTPKTQSWSVSGSITLPLFDQGLAKARVSQAKSDINSAKLAKQMTMDGIALEIRQNYLAILEAKDRLAVSTAALAQAEEQYRLAQVRYKAGVTSAPGASPLLEISDAQTALTQAQTNVVNAKYDVAAAEAKAARAAGEYAYGPDGPGYQMSELKNIKK